MIFKIHSTNMDGQVVYARIDDDGLCRLTCTADYAEFQKWLEAGNTPEPAEAPPAEVPAAEPAAEPAADEPPVAEPPADEVTE
jgi:hypothetical protein